MKKPLLAITAVLGFGIAGAVWFSRQTSGPLTVDFVCFRQTPGGPVSVFRATNPSWGTYTFHGKTESEPVLYYVVHDGSRWRICRLDYPSGHRSFFSGLFKLKPRSTKEFTVAIPPAATARLTELTWNPHRLRRTSSKPPETSTSFAVILTFLPADAAKFTMGKRSIGRRIRNTLTEATHWTAKKGLILPARADEIEGWIRTGQQPDVIWVESTPANP